MAHRRPTTPPEPGVVPVPLDVLGVRVHRLSQDDLFAAIERLTQLPGRYLITYANAHTLNVAQRDPELRAAYDCSALTYCDGAGVRIGARLLGEPTLDRLTAASFIDDFCERWATSGRRLFFVGSRAETAAEACSRLTGRHPGLRIVGHHHGFFVGNGVVETRLLERISAVRPDILFVGLGTPLQERWVLRNWQRIDAKVVWPVGALLDYVSGRVPRSPRWMQERALEWAYRLAQRPRARFRRYVLGNPLFLLRVLRQAAVRP